MMELSDSFRRTVVMPDPHQLELANTLLSIGAFLVIFLAARVLGEVMVRLKLPTILGELLGGVLIGVSGLHLIGPPEVRSMVATSDQ